MTELSAASPKALSPPAAKSRPQQDEESLLGVVVWLPFLGICFAWMADGEAGFVEREATPPSVARFEMSDAWATTVCDLSLLLLALAVAVIPMIGVVWLVRRVAQSRLVDVCLGSVVVAALCVAAVVAAPRIGTGDVTTLEVTRTNVELRTASLAARLGWEDPSVRRIPFTDIVVVDLHHEAGDDDSLGSIRATIALSDGEKLTLPGGSGDDQWRTWDAGWAIAVTAAAETRCFEGPTSQPCDVVAGWTVQ